MEEQYLPLNWQPSALLQKDPSDLLTEGKLVFAQPQDLGKAAA